MLQRLPKAVMVVGLACTIGLHWAFLQSLAWVGMVVSYSQETTLPDALVKTFDGSHPCALCKEIAKGKQSEKKPDARPEWKKFEFSYALTAFIFSRPTRFWKIRLPEVLVDIIPNPPPVPPPRFAFS